MYLGRSENAYSECVPPKALSPNQENLYSTLARVNEILNITALTMSTNSIYDKAKPLEPMYIDVVSEIPTTWKSSRRLKCLVVWLVMLTIISLTSLAFTTLMFYKTSKANGNAMFFGESSSATDDENTSEKPNRQLSTDHQTIDVKIINQLSKNVTFLSEKLANISKMPGPPGRQGPQGLRGFNGSNGTPGAAGQQGPPGQNGTIGPQGRRGFNGSNGTPGKRGTPGQQGPQGQMGPPGANGTRGPKGCPGSQGPPGPRGAGNFSSCVYRTKDADGGAAQGRSARNDVFIEEAAGKKIIGAACYSNDSLSYNISSSILPNGLTAYSCRCSGTRKALSSVKLTMSCTIQYWQCEL